ncbi:MAG: CheR family methyltransferase [Acidobacteriota bacterium]
MIREIAPLTREEQALFNEVLSKEFGLYFPESKRQILESRLEPRVRELRLRRFFDYYLKVQVDLAQEAPYLVRLVTNNETYFFREKAQFEALFGPALQDWVAGAVTPGVVRILSAGCSSGEEPYTLNIYAKQARFRLGTTEIQVEAFDIDTERLHMARSGIYRERSLRAMSDELVERYFRTHDNGLWELKPAFRRGVNFREGNIITSDAYRTSVGYDAIFCRNVLIYFSEVALHQAIENFASALRPGGLLFLGHSESIIGLSRHLETVRLDNCIAYRKVAER